jgi:hypothetical protein
VLALILALGLDVFRDAGTVDPDRIAEMHG